MGCGGSDGPNLRPELEKLTEQVEKQTEQLEQVQDDLDTERQEAADTQKELQEQIDEAKDETAEAERQAAEERQKAEAATAEAERQAAEERQKAEAATAEAERKAQEQLRQQAQASEANQRARGILKALSDTNVVMDLPAGLSATVAKSNKTLKIAASADYKAAGSPTSFTGFRSARLRSPSTLGDGFQRTLVAYTDRETSRDILVHLKEHVAKDDNKIQLGDNGFAHMLVDTLSDSVKDRFRQPDLNMDPAVTGVPELMGNRFSGSLFGISGNLVCRDGNNASCPITIRATEYVDHDADPNTLGRGAEEVNLVIGTDNILYFQPDSNRQIPLDGTVNFDAMGIPDTDGDALTDTAFMVFGWWEERPDDTVVAYNIDVFASGEGLLDVNDSGLSGTARYVGRAAGFYAETDLAADPVKIGAQDPSVR